MMNEDEYMAKKLHEYLDDYDYYVSNCCGVEVYDDDEVLCPKCKEHCEFVSKHERDYEEYENAMCDKYDSDRELAREED